MGVGLSVYQQQIRFYVALAVVRQFATQAMIAVARIQKRLLASAAMTGFKASSSVVRCRPLA
jgi:hypothetical protein